MVLIPPTKPPSAGRTLGNHEARIRVLERRRGGSGPRIVYGRIYDDGEILDAGSGDWSSEQSGYGVGIAITIDPPFTTSFSFNCTPNDNGDDVEPQPALINGSGLSESGFVMGYQVDLATVVIYFWDLDGNFVGGKNRCGFDFQAVGT